MDPHPQHFAEWGYPQWFRPVVGAFEVTAAGLLLWPAGRLYGSLIVVVIMVGAIFTHLTHAQTTQALLPAGGGWIARRLTAAPRTA